MGDGDEVGNIVNKCVVAACYTCLVCAIFGQILIRCIERESSRRESSRREQNVVHPV